MELDSGSGPGQAEDRGGSWLGGGQVMGGLSRGEEWGGGRWGDLARPGWACPGWESPLGDPFFRDQVLPTVSLLFIIPIISTYSP